jgi:precorrin-6B methylase 2
VTNCSVTCASLISIFRQRSMTLPAHSPSDAAGTGRGVIASTLSRVKNGLVPGGVQPRVIRAGAMRGLRMRLDLRCHAQVYLGLYERELHAPLHRLSAGARTAFDVGAADGAYSMFFLRQPHVRQVFAFEPDLEARQGLVENLALNGFRDGAGVSLIPSAAGDGTGGTVALDALFDAVQLPAVVKIDCEGSEVDVLRGARRFLRAGAVSWIVETHSLELERSCVAAFEEHGFRTTIVQPAWWRFAVGEVRPIAHNRWLLAERTGGQAA